MARHLANQFGYPRDQSLDLVRVSQFVTDLTGKGPLYEELHRIFTGDYPLTRIYRFLSLLLDVIRAKMPIPNYPESCFPLIITTNYDDMLEQALLLAGEPFDVVFYAEQGADKGRFMHRCDRGRAACDHEADKVSGQCGRT